MTDIRSRILLLVAVLLMVVLLLSIGANAQVVKAGHKHCVCMSHGPRGGCLRWVCRQQYERPRP